MNRNTSIQRINNLQINPIEDSNDIAEDPSLIINNRSTTPVMHKAYGDNSIIMGRNKSQIKMERLPMSSLS